MADVEVKPFEWGMFSNFGDLQDFQTVSPYIPYEGIEEIKVNAPLHHELQNLIRSKADYSNRVAEIVPSINEVNFEPLTPTYTLVSYLKDDLTLITDSERAGVNKILVKENFFGTPLPDITHPRRAVAKLQINLALTDKYKNIDDIQFDINNLLENYYDTTLGVTFNVYDLERHLEGLSYVKYARVSHTLNDRTVNTSYQLGYLYHTDGRYYRVANILGNSGVSEPSWQIPPPSLKEIDSGLETTDGSLVWRTFKKLPNMPQNSISKWQADSQYGIGEYVVAPEALEDSVLGHYMFKCVDLLKSTGNEVPDISTKFVGDFVIDGEIVWVIKEYSSDAAPWSSLQNVRLGETRNLGNKTLECISYVGRVGTNENLEFEQFEYEVKGVTASTFTIYGDKRYYFRTGDEFVAAHAGGTRTFSVASVRLSNVLDPETNETVKATIITVPVTQEIDETLDYKTLYPEERGTVDGQILWKLVENPDTMKYDWNMYVTFDYDLDILGDE